MDATRLSSIPVFADLGEAELAAVGEAAFEIEVTAGETIAAEGDFGHALYAIESGTADVTIDGTLLRTVGPGDVFGEIALISSGRRTASVTATSAMRLIVLFKRDVWSLERQAPDAAARLRALASERRSGTATGAP